MRRVLLVTLGIAVGAAIAAALRARQERAAAPADRNGSGVPDDGLAERVVVARERLASDGDG
jgi:hypothetical protein